MPVRNIYILRCVAIITLLCVSLITFAVSAKEKANDFVVVIDPGHGGNDTGESENNIVEKEVNLQIAKYLESYLKPKKGYKTILTRSSDKFVSLKERGAKVDKENADLFISIHSNSLSANSQNRKTISGAITFVCGIHDSDEDFEIAKRENRVISKEKNYDRLYNSFDADNPSSYTIFSNDYSINRSKSILLAEYIQNELHKTAKRQNKGVREGEFLLLQYVTVPAVLIEVDYLCNPNSAKYVNSSTGQKKIAKSIFDAIVDYKNYVDKLGDKAFIKDNENKNGDVFVLSGMKMSKRVLTTPSQTINNNASLPRRRRSAVASRVSAERNLETSHIELNKEVVLNNVEYKTENKEDVKKNVNNVEDVKKSSNTNTQKTAKNNSKEKKSSEDERVFANRKVRINRSVPGDEKKSLKSSNNIEKVSSESNVKIANSEDDKDISSKMKSSFANTKGKLSSKNKNSQKNNNDKTNFVSKDKNLSETKSKSSTTKSTSKSKDVRHTPQTEMSTKVAESDNSSTENKKKYQQIVTKSTDNKKTYAPRSLKSKKK